MKKHDKTILRVLNGETLSPPPVWIMRQAGRYLPEYRETRSKAGDFLSLCYNPTLASEVTLQPIRRYGFDAAILFADILLIPQALGAKLTFITGEGPRLSPVNNHTTFKALAHINQIDQTLSPIYETIRRLTKTLPQETTLIGFAGAPWTVATYMIAGRGTEDKAPALSMIQNDRPLFEALIDKITQATIHYLSQQIHAGAEVIKLFDSWAGSLKGDDFYRYAIQPAHDIIKALRSRHPNIKVIGFPRGATQEDYITYTTITGIDCLGIDSNIPAQWAAEYLQPLTCIQGNLDPSHLVKGGETLIQETKRIMRTLAHGPHIFNLGHGITPNANPEYVTQMLHAIRG